MEMTAMTAMTAMTFDSNDYQRCGCLFCFCGLETRFGEVCDDCLSGEHQG
jgi:hypothetical protein